MQNLEILDLPGESFTTLILRTFYPKNPEVVVNSCWLPFLGELYLACKSPAGVVLATIYVDRGSIPAAANGAQHRRVVVAEESDESPYIHCSAHLLEQLSPSTNPKVILWRKCCGRWSHDYEVLTSYVAQLKAGEVIELSTVDQREPVYFGSLNEYHSIAGNSWPDTLTLVNALARGYRVRIVSVMPGA